MTSPNFAALAAAYLREKPGTLSDIDSSPADWIRDFATWLDERVWPSNAEKDQEDTQ